MQLSDLHAVNPYHGFDLSPYPLDLSGWQVDEELVCDLIDETKPNLIIEVGCWLGASTVVMARHLRECGSTAKIVCVDTWLGAREFWEDHHDGSRYQALRFRHGYPTVYYQFLANVLRLELQDHVIPFPATSSIAARYLEENRHYAELIYIDGSHDYGDVVMDMDLYWHVLNPGGVMFGDDLSNTNFPGVARAVGEFKEGKKTGVRGKWIVRK